MLYIRGKFYLSGLNLHLLWSYCSVWVWLTRWGFFSSYKELLLFSCPTLLFPKLWPPPSPPCPSHMLYMPSQSSRSFSWKDVQPQCRSMNKNRFTVREKSLWSSLQNHTSSFPDQPPPEKKKKKKSAPQIPQKETILLWDGDGGCHINSHSQFLTDGL